MRATTLDPILLCRLVRELADALSIMSDAAKTNRQASDEFQAEAKLLIERARKASGWE